MGSALCGLAQAEETPPPPAIDLQATYTADLLVVSPGHHTNNAYYLDNLDLIADADLDQLIGWHGARAHLYVLGNSGKRPNDRAATVQGVNNIEVSRSRIHLYEAWLEQDIGPDASLLAGLYDLNSEFYANSAADLLIAPAFGIGSELAATGSNGPSIFPSTALAVRVNHSFGPSGYIRAAIFNADARTLGDPGGIDTRFDNGVLMIAEGGIEGESKLAAGLWTYSKRQDDILTGPDRPRRARGAYILAEAPVIARENGAAVSLFLRAGLSDGHTTPFRAAWQAGLLASRIFPARPDSRLSLGANQAWLSKGYRTQMRTDGLRPTRAETAFELTYSDSLAKWLTVQPDLQWITHPGGERDRPDVLVGGLRLTFAF